MDIDLIKEQICDVCHKTWQLGWVAVSYTHLTLPTTSRV